MKKILLIGGAGYIGSVIIKKMLFDGNQVRNLDNLFFDNKFSINQYEKEKNYEFINGDLCSEKVLKKVIKGISDVVVLAGIVGDPLSKKYPKETEEINEKGIKNCLNFFRNKNLDKVIFISTCSNYGAINDDEIADENHKLNPISLYAKSKVNIENFILNNRGKFDFSPVILRFSTAFGISPRMRFDLTLNEFTMQLFKGNELEVYEPNTWRPYCHVNDFSEIISKVINEKKEKVAFEVFNVGSEKNNYTKLMIIDIIKKYLPYSKIKLVDRLADRRNYRVNFKKINNLFKHEYVSVEDGIKEIISALQDNQYSDILENKKKYGNYEIKKF